MTQYKCSQCGRSATQQCKREDNYNPLYGKSEYRPFCNTCITIKASKYPLSYKRLGEKTTPLLEEKDWASMIQIIVDDTVPPNTIYFLGKAYIERAWGEVFEALEKKLEEDIFRDFYGN